MIQGYISDVTYNTSVVVKYFFEILLILILFLPLVAVAVSGGSPEDLTPSPTVTPLTTTTTTTTNTKTTTTSTRTTTTSPWSGCIYGPCALPTPTSSPSPTPTPAPLCPVYKFNISYEGAWGISKTVYQAPNLKSKVSNLLLNHFQIASSICNSPDYWVALTATYKVPDFYDDCVAEYFLQQSAVPINLYRYTGKFSISPSQILLRVNDISVVKYNPNIAVSAVFFFDANGNALGTIPTGVSACNAGSIQWRGSPISLLWNSDIDIDADIRVTSFPIEPDTVGKLYIWKASGNAPLLVYDPKHAGMITSAEQLFGNWTFGGKKFASLERGVDSDSLASQKTHWQNGYEALATLDRNQNGRVDGLELEPLGLWFDYNRDGKSQSGEVKRLNDVGVSSLFYNPDRIDERTNNIYVTKGYERLVNGKLISGTSVDWHSDSALIAADLVSRHINYNNLCNQNLDTEYSRPKQDQYKRITASTEDKSVSSIKKSIAGKNQLNDLFTGSWSWKIVTPSVATAGNIPDGFFSITEKANGTIVGHSYTQLSFRPENKEARGMISVNYFVGEKTKNSKSGSEIKFRIITNDGTTISSKAKLLRGGMVLTGESIATVNYNGRPVSISYNWEAKRFGVKVK